MQRTALRLILGLLAADGCSAVQGDPPTSRAHYCGTEAQSGRPGQTTELYYATTHSSFGLEGWLVRLKHDGTGSLYSPPSAAPLTHNLTGVPAPVTIRTRSGSGGVVYEFKGHLSNDSLSGLWTFSPEERSRKQTSDRVTFHSIGGEHDPHPALGVYSNVQFSEEAGDPIGMEMLLFCVRDQPGVLITWFDVGYSTYAGVDVSIKADTVRFRTVFPHGEYRFRGVVTERSITLWPEREGSAEREAPLTIPKSAALTSLLP